MVAFSHGLSAKQTLPDVGIAEFSDVDAEQRKAASLASA
jgi:hypothetical protein